MSLDQHEHNGRTRATYTSAAFPPLTCKWCWLRYILNLFAVSELTLVLVVAVRVLVPGSVFLSAALFCAFLKARTSWCCTKLLQALSSTMKSLHTFCSSLLLEEVSFPETNNRFTCTLGRSRSIWSLKLAIRRRDDALVSLKSGRGNQFPGTPADHNSCLQDSQEGSQANFYTLNVNS